MSNGNSRWSIGGRGIGTICLALFLIGFGISVFVPALTFAPAVLAALAVIAGLLLLFG
jgi:hypothetical protein